MEKLLAKMYEQSESKAEKKQYRVLNALKAAAFLNLAVFYFLYNINVAQGTNPAWDYAWWQRLTLWSIVVLCGMTFSQGSNYLKWGLGLLGVGTAIRFAPISSHRSIPFISASLPSLVLHIW